MKLTHALWAQHLGRMMKLHWWQQGKQKVRSTPAEKILLSKGIKIVDAKDVALPPPILPPRMEIFSSRPPTVRLDETHPDWNEKPCLKFGDNNVLLDGAEQAQLLMKSHRVHNALPEKVEALEKDQSPEINELIKRHIYSSHMFDAHQEKLPKIKDPLRPSWVFPRVYGIPAIRRTHNLIQKLLQVCELISDPKLIQQRKIIHGGHIKTFMEKEDDVLYFESMIDTMIASDQALSSMSSPNDKFGPLPNIYPLSPTISLQPEHIYNLQDHYPIVAGSKWIHPHTIFITYDEQVKNITERPVTETQILSRSMLKSFATAVCYAKQKYGEITRELPEPISVQCVQSNGHWFYFSVFQLNTLDISDEEGTRNVWWSAPRMELYTKAQYDVGIPTLEGYNPEIFKKMLAFYRNV